LESNCSLPEIPISGKAADFRRFAAGGAALEVHSINLNIHRRLRDVTVAR